MGSRDPSNLPIEKSNSEAALSSLTRTFRPYSYIPSKNTKLTESENPEINAA